MLPEDLYILIDQDLRLLTEPATDAYRLVHVQFTMDKLDDEIQRRVQVEGDVIVYVWRYSTDAELSLVTVSSKNSPLHRALNYSRWPGRRLGVYVMNGMVIGSGLLKSGKGNDGKYLAWSVEHVQTDEFTPVVTPYRDRVIASLKTPVGIRTGESPD